MNVIITHGMARCISCGNPITSGTRRVSTGYTNLNGALSMRVVCLTCAADIALSLLPEGPAQEKAKQWISR